MILSVWGIAVRHSDNVVSLALSKVMSILFTVKSYAHGDDVNMCTYEGIAFIMMTSQSVCSV